MSRRDRHVRILNNFGRVGEYDRRYVLAKLGWDAFTDAAIEQMASETVRGYRQTTKRHAENRAIHAAAQVTK